MAHPDGIAAHLFQLFQPAAPDVFPDRRTQTAGVVVQAYPFKQGRYAVEEKAFVGVEGEGADTDLLPVGDVVRLSAVLCFTGNFGHQRVQFRSIRAPQPDIIQLHRGFYRTDLSGCDGDDRLGICRDGIPIY